MQALNAIYTITSFVKTVADTIREVGEKIVKTLKTNYEFALKLFCCAATCSEVTQKMTKVVFSPVVYGRFIDITILLILFRIYESES